MKKMNTQSKTKSTESLVSFIWKFVRMQKWRFLFVFLFSFIWSVDSTVWPYLLRKIIYTLTLFDKDRTEVWHALKWLLVTGVCLWIFVEFCFRARDFLTAKAFPQLEADIRMNMFDHIQHHSPKYFNEHFAGSLSNKIGDMTSQVTSLFQNLMIFIPAVATSILTLLFFSQVNPFFTMIMAVWIIIHSAICFFYTSKCVEASNSHGEARSSLMGKIVDSFTNNFAVNLFYRFSFEKQRIQIGQKIEQEKNVHAHYLVALMNFWCSVVFVGDDYSKRFFTCLLESQPGHNRRSDPGF
jgi:ATP-binding cassette subfamily B protein